MDSLKVAGKVISEVYVHEDELQDHVIEWIKTTD
tara:strand:- start:436 stop:537 length:102 start_codon:yes stop_codon:yes gene_type:complete